MNSTLPLFIPLNLVHIYTCISYYSLSLYKRVHIHSYMYKCIMFLNTLFPLVMLLLGRVCVHLRERIQTTDFLTHCLYINLTKHHRQRRGRQMRHLYERARQKDLHPYPLILYTLNPYPLKPFLLIPYHLYQRRGRRMRHLYEKARQKDFERGRAQKELRFRGTDIYIYIYK
jgi:hypothetical protein